MRFESEQTRLVRASAADFVRRTESIKAVRAARGREVGFPEQMRSLMAQAGWFGLRVSESRGGAGAEHADMAALCEELGRGLVEGPILQEAVLLAAALESSPASELRDDLLRRLADGGLAGAFVCGMPAPSADWRGPAFRADAVAGGFLLDGVAARVRVSRLPEGFVVCARSDGGPLMAWMPLETERLQAQRCWLVDGTAAIDLRATGAYVPASRVIAIAGPAALAIEEALDAGAVMTSAALLGAGDAAASLTRDYLRTRVQFGKPIGSFQSLSHRAVDHYIQLQLAQDAVDQAVAALGATRAGDPARVKAVARAKSRCSEAAMRITRESIQMHGAIGFTDEYDAGLFLKRALTLSPWLGSGAQHRRRHAAFEFKETA